MAGLLHFVTDAKLATQVWHITATKTKAGL